MASRFTQLLFLALLVLFLPTIFYLRPTSPSRIYSPSTGSWYGSAGSLPGSPSSGTTQGTGVMSNDDQSKGDSGWRWPDNLVEPAKLKAGDYWKSWRESWKTQGKGSAAGSSSSAAPALPAADGNSAFASKMGNETAKAELGRATWRFLHTMTLRFPDHPTPEQRTTLSTFFHSFALLYPCGECANHFQELLKELPPQTSSRMAASLWLCSAHNRVNKRLGKAEFPCDKLDETYDCGCGPDPSASTNDKAATPAKAANLAGAPGVAGAPLRPHRRGSRRRGDTDHRYDGEAAAAEEQMDESPLDAFFGGMSQPVVERDAAVRQCGLCTVRP